MKEERMQEPMIQFESEGYSPSAGTTGEDAVSNLLEQDTAVLPSMHPLPWYLLVGLTFLLQACLLFSLMPTSHTGTVIFPLVLHTLLELMAIVIAATAFILSWLTYGSHRPGNTLIFACALLLVMLLDTGHLLSYPGMPDFVTASSMEKSLNFLFFGRFVLAGSLLAIAILPWGRMPRLYRMRHALLAASLVLTVLVSCLVLFWPQIWPRTFIIGQGLTSFKIVTGYAGILILVVAAFLFYRKAARPQTFDAASLFSATAILALSELCFTLYTDPDSVLMLLGHVYKVIAYGFIFRAVFSCCITDPYKRLRTALIESKSVENMVEFLGYHDPLTRLPNRLLLRDRLQRAIAQAQRTRTKTALLYIDLDNFKNINDSLGHAGGDILLNAVAARLGECMPSTATISRLGEDEFAIVLQDIPMSETITLPVDKVMESMRNTFSIDTHQVAITASIGIALCPDNGEDSSVLMKKADTAMYRAKHAGRNTYRFFDPKMDAEALDMLRMRDDLRLALERNEFVLHYQPQIELASGNVNGIEALIRWNHPERGMVPPGDFIPLAEETGLIVPIGEWVIQEACRQAQRWNKAGLPPLVMSVNLSGVQFVQGNVEQAVTDALDESLLPPSLLELELTESILIEDTETVLNTVSRLKKLGVKLAIDDFGTGYSSMSYLKHFDVDRLKIDRSFLSDFGTSLDDAAIVRAIIQMAHSLELRTVAEGVENEHVLQQLKHLQCDEVQGFYFAKPMPPEAFAVYLKERTGS